MPGQFTGNEDVVFVSTDFSPESIVVELGEGGAAGVRLKIGKLEVQGE